VGYLLGEHWLLPPTLTEAIRFHHLPKSNVKPSELARIVNLADTFCKIPLLDLLEDQGLEEATLIALNNLGLSETGFRKALEEYSEIAIDIPQL